MAEKLRSNGQVPSVPLRSRAVAQGIRTRPARTDQQARAPLAPRQTPTWTDTEDDEDDADLYPQRRPSSAVRYTDPHGRPVLQQGNRRYVFGTGSPPRRKGRSRLFSIGIGMLLMLGLMVGGNWLLSSCQAWQANATYGFPRVWQTDENVGHEQGKSHFLFENLGGHIFFEEIPEGDDFRHAVLYTVTVLYGPDAALVPVTATFADVNRNGKLDILIHIDEQTIVYLNTGTGFKPAQ